MANFYENMSKYGEEMEGNFSHKPHSNGIVISVTKPFVQEIHIECDRKIRDEYYGPYSLFEPNTEHPKVEPWKYYYNTREKRHYRSELKENEGGYTWVATTEGYIVKHTRQCEALQAHFRMYHKIHKGQFCSFICYAIDPNGNFKKPSTVESMFDRHKWYFAPFSFQVELLGENTIDDFVEETPISKEMTQKMVRHHKLESMANGYDIEHLLEYKGIFIESGGSKGKETFKIELAPQSEIAERIVNIDQQKAILEFTYGLFESSRFTHDITECQKENCESCTRFREKNLRFLHFISDLRVGDLISFSAAIVDEDQSILPPEISNINDYHKFVVYTGVKTWHRLNRTKESILKKTERRIRKLLSEKKMAIGEKYLSLKNKIGGRVTVIGGVITFIVGLVFWLLGESGRRKFIRWIENLISSLY